MLKKSTKPSGISQLMEIEVNLDKEEGETEAVWKIFMKGVYTHKYERAEPIKSRMLMILAQRYGIASMEQFYREFIDHKSGGIANDGQIEIDQVKLMKDDEWKDVTFVTHDGQQFRVHKFLMMSRSKYMNAMFSR